MKRQSEDRQTEDRQTDVLDLSGLFWTSPQLRPDNCARYIQNYCYQIAYIPTSIEETYLNYAQTSRTIDDQRAALGEAIGNTNTLILVLKNQRDANSALANDSQKVIATFLQSLLDQEEVLKRSSDDFQKAVEARAGCSFLDVLAFIANVVAVAVSAFQNIKGLSEQVAKFNKTDKELQEIVKSLKAVYSLKAIAATLPFLSAHFAISGFYCLRRLK